ncbi:YlaH-like family protein [Halalkalibacter alkalisediminis]|uniref:YlaH-like family protein n=1 Tax=Halalkalibacter alkalisediminis TaxID=935616 RepID=A0ABV6NF24_9BACI|nr:YlaH-like family protein [Halalkalibacter alkalisediminis]
MMNNEQLTEQEVEGLTWLMQAALQNPWYGFYSFLAVVVLTLVVFNLGFARELPVLKKVIVYMMLLVGSFVMWFLEFAFGAPIMAVLVISGIILGLYRFRLHRHRKEKEIA